MYITVRLRLSLFESPGDDPGFVAFLDGLTLIVAFFALPNGNAEFDISAQIENFEWYNGAPLLLCVNEGANFIFFGK
jgi:hypothetical protein